MGKKNHPHRKPILGLTPASIIDKMAAEAKHGKTVRTVSGKPSGLKAPLLPSVQQEGAEGDGAGRVSSASGGADDKRKDAVVESEVPDDTGGRNTQLSRVLKRMLGESPPSELLRAMEDPDIKRASTNMEAVAAVILKAAIVDQKQWAVEMIRDQTEGKPIRAAQVNSNEEEIEDQLDAVSVAALNRYAERAK